MPLTSPIPKAAMPAVLLIREKGKRPEELPVPFICTTEGSHDLRFPGHYCPLGLLPNARSTTPTSAFDTGHRVKTSAVKAFYRWWDRQTDPVAARDAVWPTEMGGV